MHMYKKLLTKKYKNIVSIINTVNSKKSNISFGDQKINLIGKGFIYEKIGDYKFNISSNSFFQTNSKTTKKLYDVIKYFAKDRKSVV